MRQAEVIHNVAVQSKQQSKRDNPRGKNRTKQAKVITDIHKTMIRERSVRQENWQYFARAC